LNPAGVAPRWFATGLKDRLVRIIIANKKYKMAEKIKKIKSIGNYLMLHYNLFQIPELTLHQIMVLALLVSYDENNNKDITLTSKQIAKHFKCKIAQKTVDKSLPKLEELGYITKRMQDFWYEYSSNYDNKRLIEVTDKTYSIVNDGLPIVKPSKSIKAIVLKPIEVSIESEEMNVSPLVENDADSSNSLQLGEVEVTDEIPNIIVTEEMNVSPLFENEVDDSDGLQLGEIEVTDEIPNVKVTEEKLNWINKVSKSNFSKDDMKSLTQNDIDYVFYGNIGIWKIDNQNSENRFLIRLFYKGGSKCKLINYNTENEFLRIDYHDLYHLLDKREIGFGEVTPELYYDIKENGLEKKPLKDNRKETAA
jgi:DNA-binding transcriptional ArsR family regulator